MNPPVKLVTALGRPASAEGSVLSRMRRRRVGGAAVGAETMALGSALPQWVWLVFSFLAALGLFTANPSQTAFAFLEVPLFALLLWRRGEPPALFFVCVYQWMESTVAVFYTDFYGQPLKYASSDEFVEATWLSMIGVLVLAAGMRVGMTALKRSLGGEVNASAREVSIPKLFNIYLGCYVGFFGLKILAGLIPSLSQPILAGLNIKWVMVILLMFAVTRQSRGYGFLVMVLLLETASGVLGFFSEFKSVYFVLGVVLLCAPNAFTAQRMVLLGGVMALVLSLGIVWQVIKAEYREYLNQGTGEQVVLVSVGERVDKLAELIGALDSDAVGRGIESVVLRVSYVQYFALSLFNVPRSVPHAHGKLWSEAVQHVFMPRFLFPNKAALDDSERTAYYTGVSVAGADKGTSIGIGYMGESYIDFGKTLMFVPVFLMGGFAGWIYSFCVRRTTLPLLGVSVATAILMFSGFSIAESNIKLLGGLLISLFVLLAFQSFAGKAVWLAISRGRASAN